MYEPELADIYFDFSTVVPKVKLFAHKHILAAGSLVFHNIFYGDSVEIHGGQSTHADPATFAIFLQSFYGIDIPIDTENVTDLLQLADEYRANSCWIKCIEFLKRILSAESVCFVLDLAWSCDWKVLSAVHGPCVNIVYERFEEVIESKGFTSCHSSTLQTILLQRPNDRNEVKVVEAVAQWSAHACQENGIDSNCPKNRRKVLGPNFQFIDLKSMSSLDIITCQRKYKLLDTLEMEEIINRTVG